MKITVSCVQMEPKTADVEANLSKMKEFIEKIKEEYPKTNLVIFPELAISGYEASKEEFHSMAETITDGRSIKFMARLAAEYNMHIVYGFPERDLHVKDVLYNSAVMINNKGNVMGSYRKVHPFDNEKTWCRSGSDFPVFDTEIGRIGIMICWDTAFPETARIYALKGCDLLVVSTNWEKPYESDWDLVTRARAFDNTLHLAAANRVGFDKALGFFGRSKIIDPAGNEIAALNEEKEGIISAEIDLSLTEKERARYYTFFKDRRPELYDEIVSIY